MQLLVFDHLLFDIRTRDLSESHINQLIEMTELLGWSPFLEMTPPHLHITLPGEEKKSLLLVLVAGALVWLVAKNSNLRDFTRWSCDTGRREGIDRWCCDGLGKDTTPIKEMVVSCDVGWNQSLFDGIERTLGEY